MAMAISGDTMMLYRSATLTVDPRVSGVTFWTAPGVSLTYSGNVVVGALAQPVGILRVSGGLTVTSGVLTPVVFNNQADLDTMGLWNSNNWALSTISTSPTSLLVPPSCKYITQHMFMQWETDAGSNGTVRIRSFKNNGPANQPSPNIDLPYITTGNAGDAHAIQDSADTPLDPATPGDFWVLQAIQDSGSDAVLTTLQYQITFWA